MARQRQSQHRRPRSDLPRLLVLTDRRQAATAGRSLAATVAAIVSVAPVAVVFREKDLRRDERGAVGAEVAAVAHAAGAPLIVASDASLAAELGAVGVHLAAADERGEVRTELITGRSCHDDRELSLALAEGSAYATVSPVYLTDSKPGYGPALGPAGLSALAQTAPDQLAVYALGGVDHARAPECIDAGAYGIAVMGALMTAADPGRVAANLHAALSASLRT